ncbi:hypothetical protein HK103_007437 [Boothiomyces macroporosus]|uniref:non-specific serine/threonine protein kinase n=1 Tax=Boothiomyces macroporosus TaxID=261099 RepID=A0AAD5UL20_9FUNG|nr:hypothetical protein HK103_007437 [Boothiomyces macroporosus]
MDLDRPPKPMLKKRFTSKLKGIFRSFSSHTPKQEEPTKEQPNYRLSLDSAIGNIDRDYFTSTELNGPATTAVINNQSVPRASSPTTDISFNNFDGPAVGQYKKICKLGAGGSGTVVKAIGRNNQIVAIKILNSYHSANDAQQEQQLHKLMGTAAGPLTSQGNQFCVVMKYIDGRTLEKELLDPYSIHHPLTLYNSCKNLLLRLLAKGYYHGDANSGNFLVTNDMVYLIDYGDSGKSDNLAYLLEKIKVDFKKLASNVYEELKYRDTTEAEECRQVAQLDYSDPDRIVVDFSRLIY